jgi:ketosteroid isomerase-like protein
MNPKLPPVIQKYVDASNRHDVDAIVSCFSKDAVVHDEKEDHCGSRAIEEWSRSTIEKYQFQFRPLRAEGNDRMVAVVIEVSGTFDGSPITLDYHFEIDGNNIISLSID